MKLTKEEMETIIRFDESSPIATVYTCSRSWKTKLSKYASLNKDIKLINKDSESVTYECPKKLISLRRRSVKRELTEEQRKELSERARVNMVLR